MRRMTLSDRHKKDGREMTSLCQMAHWSSCLHNKYRREIKISSIETNKLTLETRFAHAGKIILLSPPHSPTGTVNKACCACSHDDTMRGQWIQVHADMLCSSANTGGSASLLSVRESWRQRTGCAAGVVSQAGVEKATRDQSNGEKNLTHLHDGYHDGGWVRLERTQVKHSMDYQGCLQLRRVMCPRF